MHWTVALVAPQVTPQVGELLASMRGEMSREALQSALGLRDRKSFRGRYLNPALVNGLIKMTALEKPTSRLQICRLTDKGPQWQTTENQKDPIVRYQERYGSRGDSRAARCQSAKTLP
ncbi:Fic family protein [Alkalidesulfovibrio alkalitolerans]|uniref:Fic family protein n=1 Tax=Alkalidesulfovibrio alkalitolerans TaxID=293256 RepID=UPI002E1BB9BC